MTSIEVDQDVMAVLTRHAQPFVDTPNSVLRRLLGLEPGGPTRSPLDPSTHPVPSVPASAIATPQAQEGVAPRRRPSDGKGDRRAFINRVLKAEFGGRFDVRSPYQMMFESDKQLVYFQNFNAPDSHNLWYRLNSRPLSVLRESGKSAFVALTNPTEGYAFILPLQEILDKAEKAKWIAPHFEVNIDPATNMWREFTWDLTGYKRTY